MHLGARRRLRGPGIRILVAVSVALAAMVGFAAPSSADHYGRETSSGIGGLPDDSHHTYCFRQVQETTPSLVGITNAQRIHNAMQQLSAQTGMTVQFTGNCATGTQPATDIHWVVADTACTNILDNPCGWYGLTRCEKEVGKTALQIWEWLLPSSTRVCDRAVVKVELSRFSGLDAASKHLSIASTMCHEIGHTVGVEHYNYVGDPEDPDNFWGCMHAGTVNATGTLADIVHVVYDPHHADHVAGYLDCRARPDTPQNCDAEQDN